jgi:hypothetical protein
MKPMNSHVHVICESKTRRSPPQSRCLKNNNSRSPGAGAIGGANSLPLVIWWEGKRANRIAIHDLRGGGLLPTPQLPIENVIRIAVLGQRHGFCFTHDTNGYAHESNIKDMPCRHAPTATITDLVEFTMFGDGEW